MQSLLQIYILPNSTNSLIHEIWSDKNIIAYKVSVFGGILARGDTEYLTVFSPNTGKYGKNVDQDDSKYRHFLHSVSYQK